MTGSAVVMRRTVGSAPSVAGSADQLRAEREQLTHLLRGLAARLDELDRSLADLAWRHRHPNRTLSMAEILCERTTLENERERLNVRLGVLARQLNDIDGRLSDSHRPSPGVGTCPDCGYPSLGSGLCAFCRPHLVR